MPVSEIMIIANINIIDSFMTALDLLILLILFQLKHFVADFPLQNLAMVKQKGVYGKSAGILHSLVHCLFCLIALSLFDYFVFSITYTVIFALSILDFVIHYHIDYAKMQLSKKYTTQNKTYWILMGLDQMLHHLTYIGFALWLTV